MEDARGKRQLVARESERIPLAVEALVVGQHQPARLLEEGDVGKHAIPELGVPLHLYPLVGRQGAGLAQDGVGDGDLPDVMDQRGLLEDGQLGVGQRQLAPEPHGEGGHLARVHRLGAAPVERGHQGLDEIVRPLDHLLLEILVQGRELRVLAVQERSHLLVIAAQVIVVDGSADDGQQIVAIPRLRNEPVDLAAVDGVDGGVELLHRGDEQAVALRRELSRPLQELRPVHLWHAVVRADHNEPGALLEQLQGIRRPLRGDDLEALELERPLEGAEDEGLVVYEQEAVHDPIVIGRPAGNLRAGLPTMHPQPAAP